MKSSILFLVTAFLFSSISLQGMENTEKTVKNETRLSIYILNNKAKTTTTITKELPVTIAIDELLPNYATTALLVKYNNGDQYAGLAQYPINQYTGLAQNPIKNNNQENATYKLCLKALKKQRENRKIITTHFFFVESKDTDLYKKLINIIDEKLNSTKTITLHHMLYDADSLLFKNDRRQTEDLEIVVYPDTATIKIKGCEPKNI
jgi:hypothetical protein